MEDEYVEHQLLDFGQKYPTPLECKSRGFPSDFYEHCWDRVTNSFASGSPADHLQTIKTQNQADIKKFQVTRTRDFRVDTSEFDDWELWHSVEYQPVAKVTSFKGPVLGGPADAQSTVSYIPRRYFARCRGRNDFLKHIYFHLNGLFQQIAKSGSIDLTAIAAPPPPPERVPPLSQPVATASGGTDPISDQVHILEQVKEIWKQQETHMVALQEWAVECSRATRVVQCQTADAVFLNGVSALMTVYKAHAALYEILKIPQKKSKGCKEHCSLKITSDSYQVSKYDINSKKRRPNGMIVGPVVTEEESTSGSGTSGVDQYQVFTL